MTTWIVRLLFCFLVVEAGVCAAFLADDWKPLRHQEEDLFKSLLSSTRSGQEFVVDNTQHVRRTRQVRPLEEGELQSYFHICIDEDSREVLESVPPSPFDWHLLLEHMHEVGCKVAAVEQPLTWEEGEEFHLFHRARLRSLDKALGLFERVVLTVDLQRLPTAEPIPEYLAQSAIPLANVRGETGALVRVNHVMEAPSASALPHIQFSFRAQESVDGGRPLVVRWGDYLVPSFPLAITMAQSGVQPEDVRIELGKHIRVGNGPIIPIDEFAQLDGQTELIAEPKRATFSAEDAVLASEIPEMREAAGEEEPRCALFTNAGVGSPAPWTDHNQLQKIVSTFDVLPRPGQVETHQRLPVILEVMLLALIAVAALFFVRFEGLRKHLSFAFLTTGVLALMILLFISSHKWMPLTPILVAAVTGWILSVRLARFLPPKTEPQTA